MVTTEYFSEREHRNTWHDQLMYLDSQLYFNDHLPEAHLKGHLVGHFVLSAQEILSSHKMTQGLISSLKCESMALLYHGKEGYTIIE